MVVKRGGGEGGGEYGLCRGRRLGWWAKGGGDVWCTNPRTVGAQTLPRKAVLARKGTELSVQAQIRRRL